ncbi:MAG: patatin-like phospholipase family protein [Gemmatimonadales bacterium]
MNLVLVLSGGGAKALAHLGAFRALEERGLAPAHIVGTSMGAVVGAALATGLTVQGVRGAALGITRADVAPLDYLSLVTGMFARSLLRFRGLECLIARLVPPRRFAELKTPLTVVATDLDTGTVTLVGAGGGGGGGGGRDDVPLYEALYATCAMPLYYPPITIAGRRYGEGGLRAVLPLTVARQIPADRYVAIHVGPGFDEQLPSPSLPVSLRLPPLIRAHGEALRIMMAAQVEREISEWPATGPKLTLVRPVREREATFRVEEADRYIEAGYRATKAALA